MNARTILFLSVALVISSGTAMAQAGSLDMTFDPGTGANATVHSVVLQPDGRILIAGEFTSYNGTPRNHIARLNADGSLDMSFDPGTGTNDAADYGDPLTAPFPIAVQADGKILIGGAFTAYNGTPRNRIARLNTDGSLDISFNPGSGADGAVWGIVQQPDGQILIAGEFTTSNGIARNHVARLNTDGSLDMSFDPGTWMTGTIYSLALQPDGRILIGGAFNNFQGTPPNNIGRLNADGSLDNSFMGGVPGYARSVVQQPDGKILIGGGASGAYLTRRNSDGSADATFNTGNLLMGLDVSVFDVALQEDGKILVGGHFHNWDTDPIAYPHFFARVNTDGSLDTSFDTGIGPESNVWEGMVNTITLQPDGRILIGGVFTSYDGIGRNHIARLMGDVLDCEGVLGGPSLPGTACDDGCALNGTEIWDPSCVCAGDALPDLVELTPFDTLCPSGDPYPLAHAVPAGGTWSLTGNGLGAEVNNNLFQAGYGLPNGGGVSVALAYMVTDTNTGCTLSATQSIRWMTPLVSPVAPGDCGYTPLQLTATPVGIPGTWDYPADANGVLDRSCEARPFTIQDSVYTMHAVNGDCRFHAPSLSQGEQFQLYYKPCAPPVTINPTPDTLSNCWDPAGFIEWNGNYLTSPPNWQLWNFTGCDNSENATIQCLFYPAQHEPGQYTIVEHYTSTYYCGTSTDTLVITVTGPPVWYADADGDGLGDANSALAACEQPEGHVATATDCDDTDATITAPGAPCDDGNASTANDVLTEGCMCLGTPVDTDGDGVPDDIDCAPEDPTIQVLNAGTNGVCEVCGTETAYGLFNCLGGSPQPGGTWKRLPAGTVVSASFDASAEGAGTYQFRYVLDATVNCPGDSAVATVGVTEAPDAGVDSAHILCANADPVGLIDLLGGSPDPTGLWTAPNGGLHAGFFVPGTDPPGAYSYQVEGQGPCAGDSATVMIDLQAPLQIVPVSTPTSVLAGEVAVFSIQSSGAEWTWTPPAGWIYDSLTDSVFESTVVGLQGTVDSVCVQGVLAACVADSCFVVTIDGSVAIAETQGAVTISVYPNPGNELFMVASAVADEPYRYEVLDALGRKLLDSGTLLTPFTLDLSFLASGTYMLHWYGAGHHGSVPLVKQ